ncbi:MAG: TlpA family protein disulfide reductase [Acidobacteria bacterium]|nr:TlpA family protein disulfide reductase [Acidobacteriota bacterium]
MLPLAALPSLAQTTTPKPPKTIFRDWNGELVSNNEFVDIRMANFGEKDRTVVKTLEDGTIEFNLPRIPQEGTRPPQFAVTTVDGKAVSLDSLKGKVVVLNFWFIACAYCRALQPKLNSFKAKFGDDENLVFLAISPDTTAELKKYLAKERFDYLQVGDAEPLLAKFQFTGYPKNIVLNKQGEIVYWRSTLHAWDKFESVVRAEIAK